MPFKQGASNSIITQQFKKGIYCSQRLSRCKSLVEVSSFDGVPDIPFIKQNAIYKKVVEVGSSSILTYVFDILKNPNLKSILGTHLAQTVKVQLLLLHIPIKKKGCIE